MGLFSLGEEQAGRQPPKLDDNRSPVQAATDTLTTTGLLPVPVSPMEKMIQEEGKAKTFGKMLLGGYTGLGPLMMPELYSGRAMYKEQVKAYNDQQTRLNTSQSAQPYRDQLRDKDKGNDLAALEELAILQPDIYGPVLRDYQTNNLVPDPVTFTEGKWQYDSKKNNGEEQEPGRWFVNRQGSDGSMKRDYAESGFEPQEALPSPEWLQGQLGNSQEQLFAHQGNANGARTVANQMEEIGAENWTSGIQAKAGEAWKYFTGTEDYVTSVRKNYSDIKVRNAIGNLPPGVASDKDIDLVMEPWPEGTSGYEFIKTKMDAIANLEDGRAAYRQFEADYLAKNRKRDGLAKAWGQTDHAKRINDANTAPTTEWERVK